MEVWMQLMFAFGLGMVCGWVGTVLFTGLTLEKQIMMNSPPKLKKARKPRDPNKPKAVRAKKVDPLAAGAVSPHSATASFAPSTFGELEKVGRPTEPMVKVNGETQWPAN